MLIKYLKMTVGYLIGEKNSEGKPRYKSPEVLRGNPKLSQRLTDQLAGRDRYTSFVCMDPCSWENFGGQSAFEEFADMVERDLFVGLDKDEYNSLWVRHPREDGKTELNFYCPNLHLPTGKKIKVYYSKVDKGRMYDAMELYSREHGLSTARDPRRKRAYKPIDFTPKRKKQTAEEITEVLLEDVKFGKVRNRADVIKHLEERGFELPRTGKYLSIKVEEGSNLRLRGWPYEQDFDTEKRRKELADAFEDYSQRNEKSIRALRWKYARKLVKRRRRHWQRYPRRTNQPTPDHSTDNLELQGHEKDTIGIFTQLVRRISRAFRKDQTSPKDPASEGHGPISAQGFPWLLRRFAFRRKVASTVRGGSSKRLGWLLGLGASDSTRERSAGDPYR